MAYTLQATTTAARTAYTPQATTAAHMAYTPQATTAAHMAYTLQATTAARTAYTLQATTAAHTLQVATTERGLHPAGGVHAPHRGSHPSFPAGVEDKTWGVFTSTHKRWARRRRAYTLQGATTEYATLHLTYISDSCPVPCHIQRNS